MKSQLRFRRSLRNLIQIVACVGVMCPALANAQPSIDWTRVSSPGPIARIEDSMVYDSVAGKMIMFGGYDLNFNRTNDIWEYDGAAKAWTNVTPALGAAIPPRRSGQTMAYDPVQRVVILFGGLNNSGTDLTPTQAPGFNYLGDTWEWNTVTHVWANRTPATTPTPRQGAKMVYDALHTRMILFGGVDLNTYFAETWAWSLTAHTWTKLAPTATAPGRTFHGMVYNTSNDRVTVFGGHGKPGGAEGDFNDLWEFNGTTWTQITPAGSIPPARGWMGMSYDSALSRIVVYGGFKNTAPQFSWGDTWSFSGGVWTQIIAHPNSPPLIRDSHQLVFDAARGTSVLFGGYLADVWEFAGANWTHVLTTHWPPAQDRHSMAYDSDRDVTWMVGGGAAEVWEYAHPTSTWLSFNVGGPGGRIGTAAAYEQTRKKVILFGGQAKNSGNLGGVFGDTWQWDTATHTWTDVTPAGSPAVRLDHAMAFDAADNRIVMFGGRTVDATGTPLNDTWLWDGATWTNLTKPGGPAARYGHAITYDPVRRKVILFGGANATQRFNDIWEWDGANLVWVNRTPATSPSARMFPSLAPFDATLGGLLMFGGSTNGTTLLSDAWVWNGSTWSAATLHGTGPSARQGAKAIYDASARRMLLYGGRDSGGVNADIWLATVSPQVTYPYPVQVSPSQTQGSTQTFTALYRSSGSPLSQVWFVMNSTLSYNAGVVVYFAPGTNQLLLRNDANTAWLTGTIGSGSLSNSQVTLDLSAATAASAGGDVTLTLPMAFKGAFNGPKNIYMFTSDNAGNSAPDGYRLKGTYFVNSSNSAPSIVSVTPASGSGLTQRFNAVYRDVNGVDDLQQTYFLINTAQDGRNAVNLYYVPAENRLYLRDNGDTTWGSGAQPGTGVTLSNSQVSIDASQFTVSKTSTDLTLSIPMAFTTGFAGAKNLFLRAIDFQAQSTGVAYSQLGTFTVSAGTAPPPPSPATRRARSDFDGDKKTDFSVFRPSNGTWFLTQSATGTSQTITWGGGGDIPVPGDYDGDGKTDIGVFRPSNGTWFLVRSATGTAQSIVWGGGGDVPVPADYDGDGKTDIGVFRPSNGTWFLVMSSTGASTAIVHGVNGDIPVQADYDGDGRADIGVFRPTSGTWDIVKSSTGVSSTVTWGGGGDIPVAGDFDGDGKADVGVFRPSSGAWFIIQSATSSGFSITWGGGTDIPVAGDYDGDGKADIAVFRPASGTWFVIRSATQTGFSIVWGGGGDVPLPSKG